MAELTYRDAVAAGIAQEMERDPLTIYRARLLELGVAEPTLKDMEGEAMRKVDEATETAKASPLPSLDAIEKDVWADGGAAWRN